MYPQLSFEIVPLVHVPRANQWVEETRLRPVVLVVDDEHVIADTRVAILTSWGYAAMACYDAESAIEMALIIPPEILISDVLLTRMNGVDLAIAVRSIAPDCKVLLFSGRADSLDLLALARNAGHNFTLLQKPVHPSDLLTHLAEMGSVVPPAVSAGH
jgi:CheY-like chemotaxis protein